MLCRVSPAGYAHWAIACAVADVVPVVLQDVGHAHSMGMGASTYAFNLTADMMTAILMHSNKE